MCPDSIFSCLNYCELFVSAIVGAVIGLWVSLTFEKIRDWNFCRQHLKGLKGEYSVTLKNGKEYDSASKKMKIISAHARTIEIKNVDIEKGEIVFQSSNYGRGWYKNEGDNRYGFFELIILSNNKIAALRKFTTDNDKGNGSFKSEEASFIWEKICDPFGVEGL